MRFYPQVEWFIKQDLCYLFNSQLKCFMHDTYLQRFTGTKLFAD